MNDLQMTLLIVGGGGIAAMIAYNWWQDYRLRKQASERFGSTDSDPLLSGSPGRFEPGFGETEANSPASADLPETFDNEVQTSPEKSIFCEFVLRFDTPHDANTWKPLMDSLEQVNRKKVIYSVANSSSEDDALVWFKAMPFAGEANVLKVNVQLANRKGPLTSIEFSEVLAKLRHFADDHGADIEFPEMKEVVAKAETLDKAAAALDTLLGLHCMLPDTVDEATAIDMLAAAGWVSKGHQWVLNREDGCIATMVIHKAPSKRLLSFSIDVPNSKDPVQALGDIVTICHAMNEQYMAPLMDDSGTVLSTAAIQGIYEQLIERVRNLEDSGFKPGSTAAQTLFS